MKRILTIYAFFISFSMFSQSENHTLQSENLKGKIKSYTHKTLIKDATTGTLNLKYSEKEIFDNSGKLIEIDKYGNDSHIDNKTIYSYKNGKLISEIIYNSNGKKDKTTSYEYDENDFLINKTKTNNMGRTQFITSYFYDSKGMLTAKHKLIPSINYTMKESFVYDGHYKNLIEKSTTARIGTTKEKYAYTVENLLSKKSEYNAMGELFSIIEYKYNSHKDKISLKKYGPDKIMNYHENYEYKYDEKGNWIERTNFEKGEKVSIETRVFEYY